MSPSWHQAGCCCGACPMDVIIYREGDELRFGSPFIKGVYYATWPLSWAVPLAYQPCDGYTTDPTAIVLTLPLSLYVQSSSQHQTFAFDITVTVKMACHVGLLWPYIRNQGGGWGETYGVDDGVTIFVNGVESYRRKYGQLAELEVVDCTLTGTSIPVEMLSLSANDTVRIQVMVMDSEFQWARGGPVYLLFWAPTDPAPDNWPTSGQSPGCFVTVTNNE